MTKRKKKKTATRTKIRDWLSDLYVYSHMIVVYDMIERRDYPQVVYPHQDIHKACQMILNQDGTKIMEIYNMSMDTEEQLNERRALNY